MSDIHGDRKNQVSLMSVLPAPQKIEQIALMYSLNKFFRSEKTVLVKGLQIDPYVARLKKVGISSSSSGYHKLNLHLLYRSMHQLNEACNKLWSTIELCYHVKHNKLLCRKFSSGFLGSSTIPTLHYANMSALLSLITLFGVSSWVEKGQKVRYFNIIRTRDEMILQERKQWLTNTFGNAKSGWHNQTLQTYEGLIKNGVGLPTLDLAASRNLLADRTRLHYDILGQTSMNNVYGIDNYFKHLPTVMASINSGLEKIHQIVKPIPNGSDRRFDEIANQIPTLKKLYGQPV